MKLNNIIFVEIQNYSAPGKVKFIMPGTELKIIRQEKKQESITYKEEKS